MSNKDKSIFAAKGTRQLFGRIKTSTRGNRGGGRRATINQANAMLMFAAPGQSRNTIGSIGTNETTSTSNSTGKSTVRSRQAQSQQHLQQQQRKSAVITSTTITSAIRSKKFITLKNYQNILDLVDGLKYQLPGIGSELHSPLIMELLERCRNGSLSRASNYTSTLQSTVMFDDRYEDNDWFVEMNWKTLIWTQIRALVKLLETNCAEFPDTRLRTAFQLSKSMEKIDVSLTELCVRREVEDDDTDFGNNFDNDSSDLLTTTDVTTISASSASRGRRRGVNLSSNLISSLRKTLSGMREKHERIVCDDYGFDHYFISSNNVCDCCFYSSRVLLFCSQTDETAVGVESVNTTNTLFRDMFRVSVVPTVLFDTAYVLCGETDQHTFDENFHLARVKSSLEWSKPYGDTFLHLVKQSQVLRMSFYQRLYVMHAIVNLIVQWLWSKQRHLHFALDRTSSLMLGVPPVTLYIARNMLELFTRVDTVPFVVLQKSRKIVLHVV